MTDTWHVAQLNVARLIAPLDAPELAGFVAALEAVNALADGSPGFVWRLQNGDDATEIRVLDDDMILVNISVWQSLDALRGFVYAGPHVDALRRRREWFSAHAEPYLVLWWIRAGEIPTVEDSVARLEMLRGDGPSPEAFTLRTTFPPP